MSQEDQQDPMTMPFLRHAPLALLLAVLPGLGLAQDQQAKPPGQVAKPRIIVSAAVIPWGAPPAGERDFADTAPMQRVFQDWHAWLNDGLIDIAVPMNYARETDDRVRGWFSRAST